ncbi:MAG: (2Fe-2S)-binding protein, partial [Gammaproteobacteria bacterium]|nr:(2Fe-2S)-binding protein [Gammaproteobacteria bacterium]
MADIEIDIDGKKIKTQAGKMLIQVADENDSYSPRFCYHKKLTVAANCRMC